MNPNILDPLSIQKASYDLYYVRFFSILTTSDFQKAFDKVRNIYSIIPTIPSAPGTLKDSLFNLCPEYAVRCLAKTGFMSTPFSDGS